jgi:hypothetical protein
MSQHTHLTHFQVYLSSFNISTSSLIFFSDSILCTSIKYSTYAHILVVIKITQYFNSEVFMTFELNHALADLTVKWFIYRRLVFGSHIHTKNFVLIFPNLC